MQVDVKTTITRKGGRMTFECVPNDYVLVNGRRMTRSKAVEWFWNIIRLGDNLEVEQGAYGLFDTLVGNKDIKNEEF